MPATFPDITDILMVFVVAVPLWASVSLLLSRRTIAERHHRHHDTFSVSVAVSRTQALIMIFMGFLGTLTGWLCRVGVFADSPIVAVSFFAVFQLVALYAFSTVRRPRVMTYEEVMYVRGARGHAQLVSYDDIVRIRRSVMPFMPQFDELIIELRDGRTVHVSGLLDIDRILLRIDRFDVLEG